MLSVSGSAASRRNAAIASSESSLTLTGLYRAEYTGMVRLAFTLIGNNAEAEEVVQDSFAEISQRFDELDQPGA